MADFIPLRLGSDGMGSRRSILYEPMISSPFRNVLEEL